MDANAIANDVFNPTTKELRTTVIDGVSTVSAVVHDVNEVLRRVHDSATHSLRIVVLP